MNISRVGLAVIGDEVLMGEVLDENVSFIGREIVRIGADLAYVSILPDNLDFLVRHLSWMKGEFDWVVSTGGIGTTPDDLTRDAVSAVTGRALQEDPEALRHLERHLGAPVPDRLRRLAMIPEGAELVENTQTGAPGFTIGNFIVLPGIPGLVKSMIGVLEGKLVGKPVWRREIRTKLYESEIAHHLERVQDMNPDVRIGSYPEGGSPDHRVRLVLRSRDPAALDKAERQLRARIPH